MKKSVFALCFVALLLAGVGWWASASDKSAAAMAGDSSAPAGNPADVQAIKQLEQEMGNAMVAGDVTQLGKIYADDFATVGSDGKVVTRETLLHDFNSFHDKLEWFEIGPIDVQVAGNVAVAHGTVNEKRSSNGKDTSGQFLWMDLLKKRDGKWVVVRSEAARVQ
ncbi:MAG TPA: nuclear transport factor 2 family protein [Terracidiphilus sp.]|nr:nuclear transport factor 2 family protein [Terracidiphilus sp.]